MAIYSQGTRKMAKGLDTNSPNKRKRIVLAVIGVILLIALWALFRPELLFIHQTHNDPFPDAPDTETSQSSDKSDQGNSADATKSAASSDKEDKTGSSGKMSSPPSTMGQKAPATGSKPSPQ